MTATSDCVFKYPLTYTQLQAMFHVNPPILRPCYEVLFYIVKKHKYRL